MNVSCIHDNLLYPVAVGQEEGLVEVSEVDILVAAIEEYGERCLLRPCNKRLEPLVSDLRRSK